MATGDITATTTDLYSLGNSTNWWKEIYVQTVYSDDIYSDRVNASEINSTDINSDIIDIENNLTIGGHQILEDDGGDLIMVLS